MISIIMPAWNEEKRIEKTIRTYIPFFEKTLKNFEIIVVTDGSEDSTQTIVSNLSKEFPYVKNLHFKKRLGKGGAIIEGFRHANGKIIGFVDADCSTDPQSITLLIKNLNSYDGAIGSRWADGANVVVDQPITRKAASRAFNFLVRIFFGLNFKDTQLGAKFFKKKAVKDVVGELGLTDWAFDVDLLYKLGKKNYKVKEVPIAWSHNNESKLELEKTSLKMFFSIVGLRVKNSRFAFIAKFPLVKWIYNEVRSI